MGTSSDFDRRLSITASQAVTVISPKHSKESGYGLYMEKTAPHPVYIDHEAQERDPNVPDHLWMGNAIEPVLGRLAAKKLGTSLTHMKETKQHPIYPHIAASPDFLADNGEFGAETKFPVRGDQYGPEAPAALAELPVRNIVQVYINMAVYDRPWFLCVYVEGALRIYPFKRDLPMEEEMLGALTEWWKIHVVNRVAPAQNHASDTERLKTAYPHSSGLMIPSTTEFANIATLYAKAKKELDNAETVADGLKAQLQSMIGPADGCEGPWGKVTWKSSKATVKIDWEAIAKAAVPDPLRLASLVESHTDVSPTGSRRFLFKAT